MTVLIRLTDEQHRDLAEYLDQRAEYLEDGAGDDTLCQIDLTPLSPADAALPWLDSAVGLGSLTDAINLLTQVRHLTEEA